MLFVLYIKFLPDIKDLLVMNIASYIYIPSKNQILYPKFSNTFLEFVLPSPGAPYIIHVRYRIPSSLTNLI